MGSQRLRGYGAGGHGFGVTPQVALAYLIVSGFLFALSRQPATIAMPAKGVPNAVPAE